MTDKDKMDRIREICIHYEEMLKRASRGVLDKDTRKMVKSTRHEALAEICELVRT